MNVDYDKYYETVDLFGNPYPELVSFFEKIEHKGKLLDVGCGQGRDAIPLAKMGFEVTGIDHSKVGIEQMNLVAKREKLTLTGLVGDINNFSSFDQFDFILLDSMFHFGKKERSKEIDFLRFIFNQAKPNALITICIQKVGNKVEILNREISRREDFEVVDRTELIYRYIDQETNHSSETIYEMVSIEKAEAIR